MVAITSIIAASQLAAVALAAPVVKNPLVPRAPGAAYKQVSGDGTAKQGWPSKSAWVDFETAWEANLDIMRTTCKNMGQENNSDGELDAIKAAILEVAPESELPAEFLFAVMMQESNGCVRVHYTENGHKNPGLFQSFQGTSTCNDHQASETGQGMVPCPADTILGMVKDGAGVTTEFGLKQAIAQVEATGCTDESKYYKAARVYNSGGFGGANALSDLNNGLGATSAYVADIANRLVGYVGDSKFQPGAPGPKEGFPELPQAPSSQPAQPSAPVVTSAAAIPSVSAPAIAASIDLPAEPSTTSGPTTTAVPDYNPSAAAPSAPAEPTYAAPEPTPLASRPKPSGDALPKFPKKLVEDSAKESAKEPPKKSTEDSEPEKAPGVPEKCTKEFLVKENDTCESTGVSLDRLREINTDLDEDCSNLWLGYIYCLEI